MLGNMTNRWARFRWPARFKSDPREMGERAGLVIKADGDDLKVTTAEQYGRRRRSCSLSSTWCASRAGMTSDAQ